MPGAGEALPFATLNGPDAMTERVKARLETVKALTPEERAELLPMSFQGENTEDIAKAWADEATASGGRGDA